MASRKHLRIWGFYTISATGTSAKCNFCSRFISFKGASTGNLKRHLVSKHPSTATELDDARNCVPSDIVHNLEDDDDRPTEEPQYADTVPSSTDAPSSDAPSSDAPSFVISNSISNNRQTSIASFVRRPIGAHSKHKLDDQLLMFVIGHMEAFAIVENPEFKTTQHKVRGAQIQSAGALA